MPSNPFDIFQDGPKIVYQDIHLDVRGEFRELHSESRLQAEWPQIPQMRQTNFIRSESGALRGFHAGNWLNNHWKVVSCLKGSVLEVFIDLRPGSTTFGTFKSYLADGTNNELIIVPPGFGHAMQAMEANSISLYSTNVEYRNQLEIDINPISPEFLDIWTKPFEISKRDSESILFSTYINKS